MSKETQLEDVMKEFEIEIPGMAPVEQSQVTPDAAAPAEVSDELEAAIVAKEAEANAKAKADAEKIKAAKGGTSFEEDLEDVEPAEPAEPAPTPEAPKGKSDNFYKNLAAKYIANGTWSADLALQDEEGNEIPLEDVEDLNEETFFEIQKSIQDDKAEELKNNYLAIDKLDERRKTLVTIISEGGDLKDIFTSEAQADAYLNPFGNLDLDDPTVQERVYLNSLMTYNKLDKAAAIEVVRAAKKDLTLDTKVKGFVEDYTKKFDVYVEGKKAELLETKARERQELLNFKKSLSEEYKNYELSPTLVRKLTDSAVRETEDGYEIDSIYDQKMKDPKEAAELILFLNNKEAYLENKLKQTKVEEQMKTRRLVKMIPSTTKKRPQDAPASQTAAGEFDITVPMDRIQP